jgi:hypothetical protein
MNVDVLTGANLRHDFADVFTILNDRIAHFEILERDLVPQRNVLVRRQLAPIAFVNGFTGQTFPGLHVSDGDPDVILTVVDKEISHGWFSAKSIIQF